MDSKRTLDLWRSIYRYYYTFQNMPNTPEDWRKCITVGTELYHLFDNDPLAKGLIFAIIEWLEGRIKAENAADG